MTRRLATLVGLVCALVAPATGGAAPTIGGCPIFPADHAWNTRIDTLPVHPMSAAWINSIGATRTLHPDFGTFDLGDPIGIPFIQTTNADPFVPVNFGPDGFPGESDPPFNTYRVPLSAPVEGGAASTGDRHVLAVDTSNCILFELYRAFPQPASWTVDAAVRFDLQGYALRTDGFTSADAAGLPIFPGLIRYAEANAGLIEHAIRFTTNRTNGPHIWPARHDAGDTGNPADPPMGARFRLKATKNIDGYSTRIRAIFQAMKTYGLILADNGSRWYISGEHNVNWDDGELVNAFNDLVGSDFEAVDVTSMIIDPNSGQARQPGPAVFGGGIFVATGRVTSPAGPAQIVTGPGPGRVAEVRVFDANGTQLVNFQVYPSGFQGGVRVAACDFTGDGRAEVVSVAGPGGAPHVRIMQFDASGNFAGDLASFFAYDLGFVGGLFIACGDIDGDGQPDIILGVDAGGGPHVRILRFLGGVISVLDEFFAYDAAFRGGIRVAAGNVDGSDRASLILGAGPGGGPHVRVLKYLGAPGSWQELVSVMVYDIGFRQGIFVAAGDVAGDPKAEVITSADAGGGPHVRVLRYDPAVTGGLAGVSEFMAYDTAFRGGVRVAVGDVLAGGAGEIVTGAGSGGGPHVSVRDSAGTPNGPGFLAY